MSSVQLPQHILSHETSPKHQNNPIKAKSKTLTVIKVITVLLLSLGLAYLTSCELNKDKQWTCGNYALGNSRIATFTALFGHH